MPVPQGETATYNDGGCFFVTGARFLLSGPAAEVLLADLPFVIVLQNGAQQRVVKWALDQIGKELRDPQPGGALSIEQFSQVLLIEVMRCHVAAAPSLTFGWMAGQSDRRVSAALVAIHADPGRSWRIRDMANCTGQSQTSFAVRFESRQHDYTNSEFFNNIRPLAY